jgi:RNA polymerase sigma factor (TIGR02999 family)
MMTPSPVDPSAGVVASQAVYSVCFRRRKILRFNPLAPYGSQMRTVPMDVGDVNSRSFSSLWVPPMSEVTRILFAIVGGDPCAAEQLLPLVYDELRKLAAQKLAQEKPGQTLEATALVHEAYLRLVDVNRVQQWDSRAHFFAAAAEAMRRILIDQARRKQRPKHGGGRNRVTLDEALCLENAPNDDLLALDEALEKLAREEPAKAELVKLHYFAGLSLEEAGRALGISHRTAKRHWAYARAWLYAAICDAPAPAAD